MNSGVSEYEKYDLYKRVSEYSHEGEFLTDKEIGSKSKMKNNDEVSNALPNQVDESVLNSIFANIKIHKSSASVSPIPTESTAEMKVVTPIVPHKAVDSTAITGAESINGVSPKFSSMISPSDLLGTEKKKFYVKK